MNDEEYFINYEYELVDDILMISKAVYEIVKCHKCGVIIDKNRKFSQCPKCGAKIIGENKDERL